MPNGPNLIADWCKRRPPVSSVAAELDTGRNRAGSEIQAKRKARLRGYNASGPNKQRRVLGPELPFAAVNAVTIGYFGPAVLRVERHSVAPDEPSSWR
jgi:hypothetical protein